MHSAPLVFFLLPVFLSALPLHFEPNHGQAPSEVLYVSRGGSRSVSYTSAGVVFTDGASPIRMIFAGARRPSLEAESPLPGRTNYFTPAGQFTGIPHFSQLRYRGLYPGIDAIFYSASASLEYDFTVAPGADPRAIRLRFSGASPVWLDHGELVLAHLRHRAPLAYQESKTGRRYIAARYQLRGSEVAFQLG